MQPSNQVPAAQYLRMSTEHQQYSLDNQAAAISRYADVNNFTVTHTYRDAGKSGGRRFKSSLPDHYLPTTYSDGENLKTDPPGFSPGALALPTA